MQTNIDRNSFTDLRVPEGQAWILSALPLCRQTAVPGTCTCPRQHNATSQMFAAHMLTVLPTPVTERTDTVPGPSKSTQPSDGSALSLALAFLTGGAPTVSSLGHGNFLLLKSCKKPERETVIPMGLPGILLGHCVIIVSLTFFILGINEQNSFLIELMVQEGQRRERKRAGSHLESADIC